MSLCYESAYVLYATFACYVRASKKRKDVLTCLLVHLDAPAKQGIVEDIINIVCL